MSTTPCIKLQETTTDSAPDRETERESCTLCAKVESPGFYTGCMIQDGACTDSGWKCDGNGNLTR